MNAQDFQEQLIELQTQLAFQEDTLQALNDVITRQQADIEALQRRCEKLEQQYEQALNSLEQVSNERPPHY